MSVLLSVWEPFFFDGNRWCGLVDSQEKARELLRHYRVDECERAKIAPVAEVGKLPREYHLGAMDVRHGTVRSFGFRREHVGDLTLGEWLKSRGISLAGVQEN